MRAHILAFAVSALCLTATAETVLAEDADELVRLPGQNIIKPDAVSGAPYAGKPHRLVAGGGLIVSFDSDHNGRITPFELTSGVETAFLRADANEDGSLSAFEQIAWADSLPTDDDTLSNPARFDPNLDNMVSFDEFRSVIASLAADYASDTGDIYVSALKAPKRREEDARQITNMPRPEPVSQR